MKRLQTINRTMITLTAALGLLASTAALAQNPATDQNSPAQSPADQNAAAQNQSDQNQAAQNQSDRSSEAAASSAQNDVAWTDSDHRNNSPQTPWYSDNDGAYSVSLGTGQLISLYPHVRSDQVISGGEYADSGQSMLRRDRDYRYQFFYGGSVDSVYTDNVADVGGTNTGNLYSTSINPYLAFFMPNKTGRYLVQYSGVINPDDTFNGGPQAYHTLTVSAMGSFSERLYWMASASGSYGSESARLQGPLSFLVVQGNPVVDTSSTAVLQAAKNVAFVQNSVGLGWLRSRRDRFTLTAFHIYTGIEGDRANDPQAVGTHANSIGSRLEYDRSLTQRIDLRAYGQAETVLNGPTCNTYGAGLGLGMKLSHSVELAVSGGPQWSTSTCGSPQSFDVRGALVKNFGNQDKVYAYITRMMTTFALLDSRWEDTAGAGFSTTRGRFTLTADAGYLRGTPITTIVPAYHGYFVAPRADFRLTNSLSFEVGYRNFHGTGGTLVSGNASYAMAGLRWYPRPLHFGNR
jgi:hypothetical protein